MRRKLVVLMLAGVMTFSMAACGDTGESSTDTQTETQAEADTSTTEESSDSEEAPAEESAEAPEATEEADPTAPIKVECDEGVLEYLSYEMTSDYEGNPAILIHFNYTNNSDQSAMAQSYFYPQVFQNGVECDMAMLLDSPEAYSNLSKEIQPGTTLEVAFPYALQDTTNPVDLEVQAMSEMFSDKVYKQTINLK